MAQNLYKIIISDDNHFFVEALAKHLDNQENIEVIAKCTSIQDTIEQVKSCFFNILLLDVNFCGESSIDHINTLKSLKKDFTLIMLSTLNNSFIRDAAFKEGAAGFIGKDDDFNLFPTTIKKIHCQHQEHSISKKHFVVNEHYTTRQLEILQAIYDHSTEKEIANQLHISLSTLKSHKQQLFSKANAKNNIELIRFGITNNLIIP